MIWELAMRFIKGLSYETVNLLKRIYAQSKYHQVRRRAIMLSNEGHQIIDDDISGFSCDNL